MRAGRPDARLLLCLLLISGCSAPHNRLAGYYRTAQCQEEDGPAVDCRSIEPSMVGSLVTIPTPATASPTGGLALPERALAEYIRVLGARPMSNTAEDLRRNIAASIGPGGDDGGTANDRNFKRTLIVTVRKGGGYNPDDRLEDMHAVITLTGARFINWEAAATVYSTINAGSVQLTNTAGSSAGLTVGTPAGTPVTATATGSVSQSSSRAETLQETFQRENLTVSVEGSTGQELHIRRQGGPGVDLTGNVVVKLEVAADLPAKQASDIPSQVTLVSVTALFDSAQQPTPPGKVVLSRRRHLFPPRRDISATLSVYYVLRHVLSYGGTGVPRDQDVLLHSRTYDAPQRFVLIPEREAVPSSFGLVVKGSSRYLSINWPNGRTESLCFGKISDADDFKRYLTAISSPFVIGGGTVGWGDAESPELRRPNATELGNLNSQDGCS